jgi:hypothetical protein
VLGSSRFALVLTQGLEVLDSSRFALVLTQGLEVLDVPQATTAAFKIPNRLKHEQKRMRGGLGEGAGEVQGSLNVSRQRLHFRLRTARVRIPRSTAYRGIKFCINGVNPVWEVENTAMGICCVDDAAHSIRKSWYPLKQ